MYMYILSAIIFNIYLCVHYSLTKDRRVPKGDDEDFESLQEENTAEDSEEDEEEEEEEEEWDPKSYIIDVDKEPKKNANEHDLDVNSTQFTEELKAEEPEALEAEDEPRPNENELEGATQVSHSSSNSEEEEEEEDDEGCFSKLPLHTTVPDHLFTMEGQFQTPSLTGQNWAHADPVHSIDQTMDEGSLTLEDIEDEINDEHRIRKSNKVGVSAGSGADLLQERAPEIIPAQQIFSSANEEYSSTSPGDVPVSMPKTSELVSVSGERVTQSDIVLVDPEKTTDLDYS